MSGSGRNNGDNTVAGAYGENENLNQIEARIEQAKQTYLKESKPKIALQLAKPINNYHTQQAIVLDKVTDILESPAEYSLTDAGDDQLPAGLRHGSIY